MNFSILNDNMRASILLLLWLLLVVEWTVICIQDLSVIWIAGYEWVKLVFQSTELVFYSLPKRFQVVLRRGIRGRGGRRGRHKWCRVTRKSRERRLNNYFLFFTIASHLLLLFILFFLFFFFFLIMFFIQIFVILCIYLL